MYSLDRLMWHSMAFLLTKSIMNVFHTQVRECYSGKATIKERSHLKPRKERNDMEVNTKPLDQTWTNFTKPIKKQNLAKAQHRTIKTNHTKTYKHLFLLIFYFYSKYGRNQIRHCKGKTALTFLLR